MNKDVQRQLNERLKVHKIINKFRIVERHHQVWNDEVSKFYVIQKKNFWGKWCDYKFPLLYDGVYKEYKTFPTYGAAIENYWRLIREKTSKYYRYRSDTTVSNGAGCFETFPNSARMEELKMKVTHK